jgi:hypothetical protein
MRTYLRTAAAAMLWAVSVVGAVAGPSAASPQKPAGWACDRDVCLSVRNERTAVHARDASGCNHRVCIEVTGDRYHYTTKGYATGDWFGHIHIWGPNMNYTGFDRNRPAAEAEGHGIGQTCAEGWMRNARGEWQSVGLPCKDVR